MSAEQAGKLSDASKPKIYGTHYHDGILFHNFVLDSSIEGLRDFEVRSDDVWIVTYPKSGTHWLAEIVGLILVDGHPQKVDRSLSLAIAEVINPAQKMPLTREEEERNPVDMTPFLDTIDKAPSPRVIFTHLRLERMPKEMLSKAKVIYAARNAKDACLSWFNFQRKTPFVRHTWDESFESFMAGKNGFGPWFEHVDEFWKIRDEDNLIYLFYEDMIKEPAMYIRQIAEHINHPLSDEALQRVVEQSTLDAMKANFNHIGNGKKADYVKPGGGFKLNFLNKGGCGNWKRQFTVAQNEVFDKWYHQYDDKMAATGLKFTME